MRRGSILVKSSTYTLRKGDGNEAYVMDEFGKHHRVFQRYPPPEADSGSPDIPDAPFTAHTGSLHSDETGIPGTGRLIQGKFVPGQYGEKVWLGVDGSKHYHGIDGVIKAIGDKFTELGVIGIIDPTEIVEAAIDLHNEKQHESGHNHLPTWSDNAWRKNTMSDFQHEGSDGMTRGNWGPDKRLVTLTDNRNHPNHRFGRFVESASIPFNGELGQVIAQRLGMNETEVHKMFSFSDPRYPYIKTHRLHLRPDVNTGAYKSSARNIPEGQLGESGVHTDQRFGLEEGWQPSTDRAYKDLSVSQYLHHLPDEYHMEPLKRAGGAGVKRSAEHQIRLALGATSQIGEALATGRITQTVPLDDPMFDVEWKGRPLREYLQSLVQKPEKTLFDFDADAPSNTLFDELMDDLSQYSSFKKLFGRTTSGHAANLDAHYSAAYAAGLQPGEMTQADHEGHSDTARDVFALPGRGGQTQASTLATEKTGSKNWAKAMVSGQNPDAPEGVADSNYRMGMRGEESVAPANHPSGKGLLGIDKDGNGFRINLKPESRDNAPAVRAVMETLADKIALAGGRETRMMFPEEEARPTGPRFSHQITFAGARGLGVPEHFEGNFVTRVPTASAQAETATPPPPDAASVSSEQITQPSSNVAVMGGPITGRMPTNPTPVQQRRMGLATADDASIREIAGRITNPATASRMSPEQVEAARRAISDPYQSSLMQFQTSDDVLESTQDRLLKTMEKMQMDDALGDVAVLKALPQKRMNFSSLDDVNYMASNLELAPIDVKTILFAKGDWMRLTDKYGYPENTVKVVKAAFRSD